MSYILDLIVLILFAVFVATQIYIPIKTGKPLFPLYWAIKRLFSKGDAK